MTLQLTGGAAHGVAIVPGELLPRLFTLASSSWLRRVAAGCRIPLEGEAVIFCHFNPTVARSFSLRNVMLCVARTFLTPRAGASDKPPHCLSFLAVQR